MKKIMKRVGAFAAAAVLTLSLTGCGKKTCMVCGKEFSSGGTTVEYNGVEMSVCGDCLKQAGGMFGS